MIALISEEWEDTNDSTGSITVRKLYKEQEFVHYL